MRKSKAHKTKEARGLHQVNMLVSPRVSEKKIDMDTIFWHELVFPGSTIEECNERVHTIQNQGLVWVHEWTVKAI